MLNHENLSIFQSEGEGGLLQTVVTTPELPADTAYGLLCPLTGISVGATFVNEDGGYWRDPIATMGDERAVLSPEPLAGKTLDEGIAFLGLYVDTVAAGVVGGMIARMGE